MAEVPTLAEVLDHLNVTDNNLAVEVEGRRLAAVGIVESRVGPLAPRTVVETHHRQYGIAGPVITLRRPPVLLLSEVRVVGSGEVLDLSGFTVSSAGTLIAATSSGLPAESVQVTYQAGRPTGELPDELHEAVLLQTAILWESQRSAGGARPLGGAAGGDGGAALTPRLHRLEQCLLPHSLLHAGVA